MSFKLGITRDVLDSKGEPGFGRAALAVLGANPEISWEYLPERITEVAPDLAALYDGLYVNSPKVTRASVSRPDCRLKIIARHGVGYDSVDVAALTERGIVLTNTPNAIRRPVAVAALTLIFALAGRLPIKDRLVRENRWHERTNHMGLGLTTRTIGLIGAGGIGETLLALARPFFGRMMAADPYAKSARVAELGAELVPLEQMMRDADFVVVCCLLNDETFHLVDKARLALMKPSAFLISIARGAVVDEPALIEALRERRIAGAGIDVFEQEPVDPRNPLLAMDNVILAPHALCWTDECFHAIAATGLQSIVDLSLGKRPVHVVNPEVYAPRNRDEG
jgi:phosphoglycerate dehydrogenase-like enzyme